MKKIRFLILAVLLCCLGASGCAPITNLLSYVKSETSDEPYVSYEEKIYNEAVDRFFAALDARDKNAIRNMFSPYVQETDSDLDDQINLLLESYLGPTDICKRDGGMAAGSYTNDYGKRSSMLNSVFQVVSNGENYWCWFQLMYENDLDKKKIGISEIRLFSADYYCAVSYGEKDAKWTEAPGLSVYTEYPIGCEVRAIDGNPYKYTAIERTLTEEQVSSFLGNSNSYSGFVEQFGEPNAENIFYMFELPEEDSKPRYLCLIADEREDTIYSANITDEFGYIRTLWKRPRD